MNHLRRINVLIKLLSRAELEVKRRFLQAHVVSMCVLGDLRSIIVALSLIHISEPTRRVVISYAVFCLKKFFFNDTATTEIYTRLVVGSVRCV